MSQGRIFYLDVIRILACIMVIMMHSPIPGINTSGFILTGISFITAPCIGLFFMVSGALLLPVRLPMKEFYIYRLSKVVWPTLVWTIVYVSLSIINEKASLHELPHILLSIPFSAQGSGIMWFMYTLIGLYLIAPIISPWLEKSNRKGIEFILFLWTITLFYPVLSFCLNINESYSGILYYFGGYAGYFLLGYYLRRYVHKTGFLLPLLMIAFPVACCGISYYTGFEGDFYKVFWYLSVFVASMACGWFILIKNLYESMKVYTCKLIPTISSLCFGIYLCHIIIMHEILWKIELMRQIGSIASIATVTFLTFLLSLLLSWGIAHSSLGRYIVGYSIKKTISQ